MSISILDDHSRYLVGCKIYDHVPSKDDIIDLLEEAIANYGKPEQILTDHGTQFYANKKNGLGVSTFDLWCYENGIRHILAGVRKPTTNGKVERWHRTMDDEFLKYTDPSRVKEKLKEFLDWYNNERLWICGDKKRGWIHKEEENNIHSCRQILCICRKGNIGGKKIMCKKECQPCPVTV